MKTIWQTCRDCWLLLAASVLLTGPVLSQDLRLVATDWPPYVDTSITRNGVAPALVLAALQRAGYKVTLFIYDWPRALTATQAGDFDAITTLWFTEERARTIAFTEPFIMNELKFMRRVGDQVQANVREDLVGLRVGVVEDFAYGAQPYDTTGIEVISGGSVGENVEKLLAGEVDLILGDGMVLSHEADKLRAAKKVELLPTVLESRGLRLGVSRKHAEHEQIVADFNAAITAMKADGTYNNILGQYRISN